MPDNVAVIREFIDAWSSLDADRLAAYFTEDGTYHNMPTGPVSGRDSVRDFIRAFLSTWTETRWDVIQILGQGDLVFAERVDRTKTTQGDVDLPCVGVFEMEGGLIRVWRDYFDLSTYMNAMS
ncbi:MAG: SgcJ/EcaC family oxidoreductase [Pseudomonadales bacterium]|jgi:limonene-1,2-epoxide hydrolase